MNTMPENNLFEITLSQQGATWLLRLFKVVRWLFILGIVLGVLNVASIVLRIGINMQINTPVKTWTDIIEIRIFPVFDCVLLVVTLIQIYYYYTFARKGSQAIDQQQSDQFNNAFMWLLKSSLMACVMFILQFILIGYVIFRELKVLSKIH